MALLIIRQLVTAAYICILVDGNPICANSNFHPSSYGMQYPYVVLPERKRNRANNRYIVVQGDGTSDRISATIYADFPNDPSATMATPGCGLIVSWPDSIRSVYWMNDTALTYTDGDQTFFQNCFEESDGLMDNPYFIPPESVAASSTTAPPPAPTRATQSCHGVDHQFWCAYDILIRVPYIGSADCDLTYHALEDYKKANAELTNWHCEEQDGFIHLYFNANVNVAKLNSALEQRYPSVDSFNCGACST